MPFCELVPIWSSFLSILLCSKYLQSNFEVPGPSHSISLGLIPTVLGCAIIYKIVPKIVYDVVHKITLKTVQKIAHKLPKQLPKQLPTKLSMKLS